MSNQTEPLKPITEQPEFILQSLDPDRPQNKYKVLSRIGKAREKQLRWALNIVAQRELKKANQVITGSQVENWLMGFSADCPDAIIVVLSFFIEPATPNAASVEDLYWNDKLEEKFVEGIISGFTMSSTIILLSSYQIRIADLEKQVSALEEQIANSHPQLSLDSANTESSIIPSSDTNGKMENPQLLPESSEAE
jgi:hypothetical protein